MSAVHQVEFFVNARGFNGADDQFVIVGAGLFRHEWIRFYSGNGHFRAQFFRCVSIAAHGAAHIKDAFNPFRYQICQVGAVVWLEKRVWLNAGPQATCSFCAHLASAETAVGGSRKVPGAEYSKAYGSVHVRQLGD